MFNLSLEEENLPPAETYPIKVYTNAGITYLPHYFDKGLYVGPGFNKTHITYTEEELTRAGAVASKKDLWSRHYRRVSR